VMKNETGKKHRCSIRLSGYDYSRTGAYFVTICTRNRECLFGEIVNGHMQSKPAGQMIQTVWDGLPNRFHFIELHAFTVMPNHIHGIIGISGRKGDPCDRPGSESNTRPCIRPESNDKPTAKKTVDIKSTKGDHENRGNHQDRGEYKIRPYGTPDPGPHGTLPETMGRVNQSPPVNISTG
jgi:putative transposase